MTFLDKNVVVYEPAEYTTWVSGMLGVKQPRPFYDIARMLWEPSSLVREFVARGAPPSCLLGIQIRIFTRKYEDAAFAFHQCALRRRRWNKSSVFLASMNKRTREWWVGNVRGGRVTWLVNETSEAQQTGTTLHDVGAYAEMIALGMCRDVVVSARSTYGAVAVALTGKVLPIQMWGCEQQTTSEPCFACWARHDKVEAMARSLAPSLRLPGSMLRSCG